MKTQLSKSTSHYCVPCAAMRDGTTQFTTSSGRKYFFTFVCSFCQLTTDGFYTKKRKIKPDNW